MPARRGIRPSWGNLVEAEDLLRLHRARPLTHRQALACAHLLYDPVGTAPFLTAALKYMYRYLIMSQNLESGVGANYDKVLSEYFVSNHLQPAVALAIATKRRLQTRRSWRLDPCVPYDSIRTSLYTAVDGSWGCLSGSASLTYLIQGSQYQIT